MKLIHEDELVLNLDKKEICRNCKYFVSPLDGCFFYPPVITPLGIQNGIRPKTAWNMFCSKFSIRSVIDLLSEDSEKQENK